MDPSVTFFRNTITSLSILQYKKENGEKRTIVNTLPSYQCKFKQVKGTQQWKL